MANLLKSRQLTIFDSQAKALIDAMSKDEAPASTYVDYVTTLYQRLLLLQDAMEDITHRLRALNGKDD